MDAFGRPDRPTEPRRPSSGIGENGLPRFDASIPPTRASTSSDAQIERVAAPASAPPRPLWFLGIIPPFSWIAPLRAGRRLDARPWRTAGLVLLLAALLRLFDADAGIPGFGGGLLHAVLHACWPLGFVLGIAADARIGAISLVEPESVLEPESALEPEPTGESR